jgi:hypothetical protein
MANVKRIKTTGAVPIQKRSKHASKNPDNKTSSTADVSAASATSPTAPPKQLGFFSLPPELRNIIYRYVLVSNERIKVQPNSGQRSSRGRPCHLTVLPALATVSKQVRLETQRIFFEENQFEITPEILKHRELAPLAIFRSMHRQLGLEIRTLRVCREIQKRCNGHLFRFTGCFTVSKDDTGLSISNEVYSATYIGRSPQAHAALQIHVCGCFVQRVARAYTRDPDIMRFLHRLCLAYRASCNDTDMSRREAGGQVVEQGNQCWDCGQQGLPTFAF